MLIDVFLGFFEANGTFVQRSPDDSAFDTRRLDFVEAFYIVDIGHTPPEAITGMLTDSASFFVASTLTPCIMPSRLMSV